MAYDTILSCLDGSLRYADAPSTIYVASIKGHPEFVKLGFCQLAFRNQRRADPFIDSILYESCRDEIINCNMDMPRNEAFLIEQFLHEQLTRYREVIPELEESKWSGRYETFHISQEARPVFLDWIQDRVRNLALRGFDALEEMLDQLVSTAAERELYDELKKGWYAERRKRMARIARMKVKA